MTHAMVAGAVANKPGNAGAAWTRMSWVQGLRKLGFEVHFVEQLSEGLGGEEEKWFRSVIGAFGLEESATLLGPEGTAAYGLLPGELEELAAETALLLNISGHLDRPRVRDRVACRVFIDLDPGYTQVWCEEGLIDLANHDHWFSVGTQVGGAECPLPDGGWSWRPTLQPVCLAEWPKQSVQKCQRFTTVAAWRGVYGPLDIGARSFGPKAHEFRRFLPLPQWTEGTFELALQIHAADEADLSALKEHGWRICDPREVAADPEAFRAYVQGSSAEISVAQAVYARTGTGWFSDRTARYLASGRPAVVQDTGLEADLTFGKGLLTFRTLNEAACAVEAVRTDYAAHCRAARRLAEEHLAAGKVLARICEEVAVAP